MKEGYKYVYSLLNNGNVFYIGCTNNLIRRYKQHLADLQIDYPLKKHLLTLVNSGYYPDMNIIDYLPEKEALKLEFEIVMQFGKAGHHIFNDASKYIIHSQHPKNIPDSPKYKDQLKAIKYKIDRWHHIEGLPYSPWKPYPESPFKTIK